MLRWMPGVGGYRRCAGCLEWEDIGAALDAWSGRISVLRWMSGVGRYRCCAGCLEWEDIGAALDVWSGRDVKKLWRGVFGHAIMDTIKIRQQT